MDTLACCVDALAENSEGSCDLSAALAAALNRGISEPEFYEQVEGLISDGSLIRGHTIAGLVRPSDVEIPPRTILLVANERDGIDIVEVGLSLGALIANEGVTDLARMTEQTGSTHLVVLSILRVFRDQQFLALVGVQMSGPHAWSVHSPTAGLTHWLEVRTNIFA